MGTSYEVKWIPQESDGEVLGSLQQEVEAELQAVNDAMSTWIPESEISRFNKLNVDQEMEISDRFAQVLERSQTIYKLSDGAFDPTLGPLIDVWGFGAEGTRTEEPSKSDVKAAMKKVGMSGITLTDNRLSKVNPGVEVNLSAVAKGYAVDRLALLLEQRSIQNYYIEIGGEVFCKGVNASGIPWKIGIQVPVNTEEATSHRVVSVLNRALATSGDYRNFYDTKEARRHHILDARTGEPADHWLASVSVLAHDCMTADAVATALYVMGTTEGMAWIVDHPDLQIEALFIDGSMTGFRLTATPGFEDVILDP